MNKKGFIAVVAFCLITTLFVTPVLAPAANNVFAIVQDVQSKVNTIISELSAIEGMLTNLYQGLWSASDSVKNDTSHIANTVANLGEWTLPAGAAADAYDMLAVSVPEGKAAQFTITVNSEVYLNATLFVWVDVSDKGWADMRALELDLSAVPNEGTATFVGNLLVMRLDVHSPPPFDKQIDWAYMAVAPPGVQITETTYSPPAP